MQLGTIFSIDEYTEAYNFVIENKLFIIEIEAKNGERQFQIVEYPKPTEEDEIDLLRVRRENECFTIVNRGKLWYDGLTEVQVIELRHWYNAWLDVTETKVIPTKPNWLR